MYLEREEKGRNEKREGRDVKDGSGMSTSERK